LSNPCSSLSGELVKFGKKLLGEKDVEVLLQKLDRLTQEESQTVATLTLEVVHDLAKNLKVVMESELRSFNSPIMP
jgi:GTPase involved in cell partitioning and DNA repair